MVMTINERAQAAIPHQDTRNLSCSPGSLHPAEQTARNPSGDETNYGESVMEMRVQLKVCEGCGCLWYRAQTQGSVYCKECETRLRNFPAPESRKRRGRPEPNRSPGFGRWPRTTGGAQ